MIQFYIYIYIYICVCVYIYKIEAFSLLTLFYLFTTNNSDINITNDQIYKKNL